MARTFSSSRIGRCGVLLALMAAPAWAQPPAPVPAPTAPAAPVAAKLAPAEAISERVGREMELQGLVGVSVAVSDGERIVFTGNWGWMDREKQVHPTDATLYRWASVSKPMTAVAAMQLAAAGKLDLDADVRKYVPEFPDKGRVITCRQLLTHQGGIVHYSNGTVIRTERKYDTEHPFKSVILALDTFKDSPLVCEPGEKHSYTTHGYILLGAAVERAGGEEFAQQVLARIAKPLGMTALRPDYHWEGIPNRTQGYRKTKDGKTVVSNDVDVSWKLPGGGWVSNAGDMARFGAGMLGSTLVDEKTRAAMWTDQKTRDGKPTGYGLGFGVGTRDGKPMISHSGAQEKTATFLLILPKHGARGVVVAVMCNTEGAKLGALARDIAKIEVERQARP